MRRRHSTLDDKADSLVFRLKAELAEGGLAGPEPNFHAWVEAALFADTGTAGDEANDSRSPRKEREAWQLFHDAIEATGNLLELYKTQPELFQRLSRKLSFLPCFMSWHPDAERFNRRLFEFSQLGADSMYGDLRRNPKHLAQQSWPVRSAYALIMTIQLTLDTYPHKLARWAREYGYGVRHPVPLSYYVGEMQRLGWNEEKQQREMPKHQGKYLVLPAWTEGLKKIRQPFNKKHVLDYWRVGKELILEEMPGFHLRPEWEGYPEEIQRRGERWHDPARNLQGHFDRTANHRGKEQENDCCAEEAHLGKNGWRFSRKAWFVFHAGGL